MAPSPRAPGIRLGAIWVLIVACVAAIVWERNRTPHSDVAAAGFQDQVQLTLVSRYAVGCKLLFGVHFTPKMLEDMTRDVRNAATSDEDQLRIVPVIAELQGNERASAQAYFADSRTALTAETRQLKADALLLGKSYAKNSFLPLDQQRALQNRYGWFGSLIAWQLNGDQIARDVATSKARTTVVVFFSLILGGGLCLLAGLVLAIIFFARWTAGEMPPRFAVGDPSAADAFVEGFAIYLGGFVVMILLLPLVLPEHVNVAWNLIIVLPFVSAFGWIRYRGLSWSEIFAQAGICRGRGIVREMCSGIVGYISGLPLLAASLILCAWLSKLVHTIPTHPIEKDILAPGWTRLWLYVLACIYAPFTEELMFRGLLFRHLSTRMQWFVSALIVSLIFAAIHPQGWTAIPVLGAIAMVLTFIRHQRDSLVGGMTAHALNNFIAITFVVLAAG